MAYASPSAKEIAAWSGLHSTTTIKETLSSLGKYPELVPKILLVLLESIKNNDQDIRPK
jgi:hypothetical protein